MNQTQLDELKELGFETAVIEINRKKELAGKLHTAYQKYQFITKEDVDTFNKHLMNTTTKKTPHNFGISYNQLIFIALSEYPQVPPPEVLGLLKQAKTDKCFDTFSIAKIESVVEIPDPILFGQVNGCTDLFYIAQWDNDVSIEEILELREEKKLA